MTVSFYLRVSTDVQTHANQKLAVERYCRAKGYTEYMVVEDKASGTVNWQKRRLADIVERAKLGDIPVVSDS